MLSNTLRLNFCHLKNVRISHPLYQPRIIGHILKNKQKNKCVCLHEIIRLIIMEMKMKTKERSHRYDTNRPFITVKQLLSIFYTSFFKLLQAISWDIYAMFRIFFGSVLYLKSKFVSLDISVYICLEHLEVRFEKTR